jgi:hypothetical protein
VPHLQVNTTLEVWQPVKYLLTLHDCHTVLICLTTMYINQTSVNVKYFSKLQKCYNPFPHSLHYYAAQDFFCVCEFIKTESQPTLLHGCGLGERSSGGIWKFKTSSFKCYVDHSHTMYSSGNIDVWNWAQLFESSCIFCRQRQFYFIHKCMLYVPLNATIFGQKCA